MKSLPAATGPTCGFYQLSHSLRTASLQFLGSGLQVLQLWLGSEALASERARALVPTEGGGRRSNTRHC